MDADSSQQQAQQEEDKVSSEAQQPAEEQTLPIHGLGADEQNTTENPTDNNTMDNPDKVSIKQEHITLSEPHPGDAQSNMQAPTEQTVDPSAAMVSLAMAATSTQVATNTAPPPETTQASQSLPPGSMTVPTAIMGPETPQFSSNAPTSAPTPATASATTAFISPQVQDATSIQQIQAHHQQAQQHHVVNHSQFSASGLQQGVSQQLPQQPLQATPTPNFPVSLAATAGAGQGSEAPVCANCNTQRTPLWRRDEQGAVLCNACGLYLKLHGRPRPISLKTDVIKSRNRVKTARTDMAKKKQAQQQQQQTPQHGMHDSNGMDMLQQHGAAAALRRASQRSLNGQGDDTNHSPVSRTGTPNMYGAANVFQTMGEPQFQPDNLHGLITGASPGGAASPMNGNNQTSEPQTTEQLLAANSSLKTRVSELEVIQELYRGRLEQLEADETNARQDREDNARRADELDRNLNESHHRENLLKHRLDEIELEMKAKDVRIQELENNIRQMSQAKDARIQELEAIVSMSAQEPPRKKARVGEPDADVMTGDDDKIDPAMAYTMNTELPAEPAPEAVMTEAPAVDVSTVENTGPVGEAAELAAMDASEAVSGSTA